MAPQIERVAENFVLGEGPHWDEDTQSLYFVDVLGHTINRYDPTTKKVTTAATDAPASIIIPIKGQKDTFLITKERELRIINWDGKSDNFSVLKTIENKVECNFNDAKCDPTSRLWIGTSEFKDDGNIVEEAGSLYAIEKNKITKVADKISISNGLAFNTDLKKLYYIDSHNKTIDEFDLDVEQGTIANRRPIFTLEKHDIPGFPDGMAIDTDGNLWVALFNGGRVIKIDPRKPETLLYTISLAYQVTSVAFGGRNLDELYVTTGRMEFGTTGKLLPPEHGALYRVTGLGVKGFPGERYAI